MDKEKKVFTLLFEAIKKRFEFDHEKENKVADFARII